MHVEHVKTLAEPRMARVKRPVNFNLEDEQWFLPWENYSVNKQDIFLVHDTNVTDKGIVFNLLQKSGKNLVSTCQTEKFNMFYLLKVNLLYKRIGTDNEQVYVLAFDPWSARNYYHWVVDTLPRLYILREELHDLTVLLPRNARRFMYESLQLFKPKATLELKKHTYARVKNLCLPRPVADSGRHDGNALSGLKNFILSSLEGQSDTGMTGERIYVSRANQAVRRIHNEDEVREMLKTYGFSIIYFENMSFADQVAVMRKAKYVVSSHGANLTNILFMPEKSKVLEINKSITPNLCYYSLASSIDLDYYYQFCPIVSNGPDKDNSADLNVDIEKLRKNVEAMLMH